MSALTESVKILHEAGDHPVFAVIVFTDYQDQAIVNGKFKM